MLQKAENVKRIFRETSNPDLGDHTAGQRTTAHPQHLDPLRPGGSPPFTQRRGHEQVGAAADAASQLPPGAGRHRSLDYDQGQIPPLAHGIEPSKHLPAAAPNTDKRRRPAEGGGINLRPDPDLRQRPA